MDNNSLAYKVELQISYRIYPEISQTSNIQADMSSYRENNPNIMRVKGGNHTSDGSNARPHTPICRYAEILPKYIVPEVTVLTCRALPFKEKRDIHRCGIGEKRVGIIFCDFSLLLSKKCTCIVAHLGL